MSSKFKKLSAIAAVFAVLAMIGCGKGMPSQGAKHSDGVARSAGTRGQPADPNPGGHQYRRSTSTRERWCS